MKPNNSLLVFTTALISLMVAAENAHGQLKIYYIRHAEGGHNVKADWLDVPAEEWPAYVGDSEAFTPVGKAEQAMVASKLKQYAPFDFVASSPAWRSRNTILPYMMEAGLKGEVWPELQETHNSSLVISQNLPQPPPASEILGAGNVIKLPPKEAEFFSVPADRKNAFRRLRLPGNDPDKKEKEAAAARLIQQQVIKMIRERFAGSDKSILLAGHGSSGKGLLRVLTNDIQAGCREGISNSGIWMVEEQPNGEFKVKIYNDAPVENGKPVAVKTSDDGFKPDKTATYKVIDGTELKLHYFLPADHKLTDQSPAVVFFFGGGWNGGTPKQFYQQASRLADLGMVAISADYRVKSRNKTTPFECVKDGKSAIRWVRQHASELGVDPNRVVAAGGSAGGHVAACTGTIQGLEEAGEDLSVSSVPNAMILFNPVLDTTAKGYGASRFTADRQTEISPCHHVRPGAVPTIVFHGTDDKTVPFENANRFAKQMNETGNSCQLEAFKGRGHGFFNGNLFRPKTKDLSDYMRTMRESETFLKLHGILR